MAGDIEFCIPKEDAAIPKPAPQMYQDAITRLGCQHEECLILEDNGVSAVFQRFHLKLDARKVAVPT